MFASSCLAHIYVYSLNALISVTQDLLFYKGGVVRICASMRLHFASMHASFGSRSFDSRAHLLAISIVSTIFCTGEAGNPV